MNSKSEIEEEKKEIEKEIFFIENEIKKNIISNNINHNFKKYGILNKDWHNNYQNFIHGSNPTPTYDINYLTPVINQNYYNYNNITYKFLFPNNFIIVTKKVINILSRHFDVNNKNEIYNLIFEIIIGGNCIMIKDKNNKNVLLISRFNIDNKQLNYNNEIEYKFIYNN